MADELKGDPSKVPVDELEGLIIEALQQLESERRGAELPDEAVEIPVGGGEDGKLNTFVRILWNRANPAETRNIESVLYWKR